MDENYMYDGVVAGQCGAYRTKIGLSMLLYVWCYEVEDSGDIGRGADKRQGGRVWLAEDKNKRTVPYSL